MIPFYALIGSFLLFKTFGLIGISHFEGWQTSLQASVAVMFALGASAHWGAKRADLIRMVPPVFPKPAAIVTITGWFEIAGAIGLLFPATAAAASAGLALLLLAMFPANVLAARKKMTIGGRAVPGLAVRTLLQIVFIVVTVAAGTV